MLLMGGNSSASHAITPKRPAQGLRADLSSIHRLNVLAVPSELPVKTVAELVALARGPVKLSCSMPGVGTSQHIWAAELFKYMAHVDIAPDLLPYRGTTALMPDSA